MAKKKQDSGPVQETRTDPAREPETNETDGEPIFHADEEGGDE